MSATQTAAPAEEPERPEQWTDDDVKKSTPAELVEAMDAGLLRDLGYGPTRRRPR